jgi:hypothetical protein
LINRESSGIPDIIQQIQDVNSGGNEAEGLFQITPRTWRANGGTDFARSARLATPQQQAIVAARIFTRNPSGSDWGAGRPGREDASQLAAGLVPLNSQEPAVPDNRPDFNEFAKWCDNNQDRGGTDIDLWLLHTQEGGGGDRAAEDLADFLISSTGGPNPVSYHYTGSQASDGGVTIVDVVDTDQASWSVGNSNNRSINFCFAGSSSSWSREDWLRQAKVIDVAAYLFVQDCAKYPKLRARVIAPNYSAPPGAADHRYCTAFLKDGNNHTDVGPNFPWDVFTAAVAKYASGAPTPAPAPTPPPVKRFPQDYSDRELLEYIAAQLGPGDPSWASKGKTLRDKVWGL